MATRRLRHYELLDHLGQGGMGEVWRARDERLNRDVAVKILSPGRGSAVMKERFLREARAASALIHPNIITIHEINADAGVDFIVMEYVPGETLAAILTRGCVSIGQALRCAIQIVDALSVAHAAGIIHRDLKPGNVMVTSSGLVKVLDFGLAKRVEDADNADGHTTAAPLTVEGVPIGTPAYMSPEQAMGDPIDTRSDLFSFGVVLYEMLAGVRPFQGDTGVKLTRQIVHAAAPRVRAHVAEVSEALDTIVDQCLSKDPSDRPQQAAQLGANLRKIAAGLPPTVVEADALTTASLPSLPVDGRPSHRRRIGGWALASVVVLAGLAAAPFITSWANERAAQNDSRVPDADASPQVLYNRASDRLRAYYREDNLDVAIAQLERALTKRPAYPQAEARLGIAYWRRNSLNPDVQWRNQALAHAQRAVAGDPQLALSHFALGLALAAAGRLDDAAAAYDRAATLDPSNWELRMRMGDLAVARSSPPAAEQHYRQAIASGPNEWETHTRLGTFFYGRAQYEDAVREWQRAHELAPDHPRTSSNLAAVFHQLGRTDEAAALLQRSIEIAPDSLNYSNLGTLLYFQGKYPEAAQAFEASLKLGANNYQRWGYLADAARMTSGDATRAHEAYTRALQLGREALAKAPKDPVLLGRIALYLARDGQKREAVQALGQLLAEERLSPAVLFNATLVAEIVGQRNQALTLLGRTLESGYQLREVSAEPDLVKLRTDPAYHRLIARREK